MRLYKTFLILFILLVIASGCVFYPKRNFVNSVAGDDDCRDKEMSLKLELLDVPGTCNDPKCLAAALVVGGTSFIVSGSIVLVGNTVYWLEREYNCDVKVDGKKSRAMEGSQ